MPDLTDAELQDQLRRYGEALGEEATFGATTSLVGPRGDRRGGRLLAVAAAVVVVAGFLGVTVAVIGSDDDRDPVVAEDPELADEVMPEELADRTFVVVAIEADGVNQALAARRPTLHFTETSLTIDTGCNGIGGPYTLDGRHIAIEPGSMTLMACSGSPGLQESLFQEMFLGLSSDAEHLPPSIDLVGSRLQLRTARLVLYAIDAGDALASGQPTVPNEGTAPTTVVSNLIGLLRAGLDDAAVELWRGAYQSLAPEGDDAAVLAELDQLIERHPWLLQGYTLDVTPSFSWAEPLPVVTALSEPDAAGARHAAAFLLSEGPNPRLQSLPLRTSGLSIEPGTFVRPGDVIVLDDAPVEGGVTVHVNGVEVPSQSDVDDSETRFTVPRWVRGEIVVTVSVASPELPTVYAAWFPVT